jgi:very-short-patch-repair endonuclease
LLRGLSIPFEREKIIYYNSGTRFILADFFIPDQTKRTEGIIVECDGSAHAGQLRYDAERDQYFKKVGYAVLRFTNKEVLKTPGAVRERLERELK